MPQSQAEHAPQTHTSFNSVPQSGSVFKLVWTILHYIKVNGVLLTLCSPLTRPLNAIGTSWEACLRPAEILLSRQARCYQLRPQIPKYRHMFSVA